MWGSRAEAGALERRGVLWGLVGVAIVVAITFIGSDGLVWFDAALIGYLFGIMSWCSASPTGTLSGSSGRPPRCFAFGAGNRSDGGWDATPLRCRAS